MPNPSPPAAADAVVIGSGPNALVAANALVDAGWDVVVLEQQPSLGGAVRSAEVAAPGYVTDLFSAFYPLAAASPVLRGLDLGRHGLAWSQAPAVLAHVTSDGGAAVLHRNADDTAAGLDAFAPGDGDAWLRLVDDWRRLRDPLLDALFTTFPPVGAGLRLLRRLGTAGALRLARQATMGVRRFAAEQFDGAGGRLLLTGNALHTDLGPEAAGSALFGWLLCMLGQDVGFPVPRGGSGELSAALAARAVAGGAQLHTGAEVTGVEVAGGRATGVRLASGERILARRAVLAGVSAPALYTRLLEPGDVPARLLDDLRRFQWDHSTLKVNWALRSSIPWRAAAAAGAGTVHVGADEDGIVDFAADLTVGRAPRRPFLLVGQMTTADPSRSPAGTESAWAYTHLPRALADDRAVLDTQVQRLEETMEQAAPGFGDLVVGRHVQHPLDLQDADANLSRGAINGGTAALHQELVFRPTPGLGRPGTPIAGLYLASASAHPGGGVHGACGWNAARAALRDNGRAGTVRAALARTAWSRVLR